VPEKAPEDVPVIFHSKSKKAQHTPEPAPPPPLATTTPAEIPSLQQLGGMFNGLIGNVFENENWWLWAFFLIILINPELRKKLFGKREEPETGIK